MTSFTDGMLAELCRDRTRDKFRLVFSIGVFVVFLMLLWLPFVDQGSATFVIVVVNLISGGSMMAISAVFLWGCPRWTE